MECNKDEALKAVQIAESKMQKGDFEGGLKFATKAKKMYEVENIAHILTVCEVHSAAQKKLSGSIMDWYGILQTGQLADEATVKKQYRKLALMLHPDKNKFAGAEAAFKLIGEANSVLGDKAKRSVYDMKYKAPVKPAAPKAPAKPAAPKAPEKPAAPKAPEKPAAPKAPAKPATPKAPAKPAAPKASSKPPPPKAPANPGVPKTPANPVAPKASSESSTHRPNGNESAAKGNQQNNHYANFAAASAAAAMAASAAASAATAAFWHSFQQSQMQVFWTPCKHCNHMVQYYRNFLNATLLCPNCMKTFTGHDVGEGVPPSFNVPASEGTTTKASAAASKGTKAKVNAAASKATKAKGSVPASNGAQARGKAAAAPSKGSKAKGNVPASKGTGSMASPPASTNVGRKRVRPSQPEDSGEIFNSGNGNDMKDANGVDPSVSNARRSCRQKPHVSYVDMEIPDDDDDGLERPAKKPCQNESSFNSNGFENMKDPASTGLSMCNMLRNKV